MTADEVMAYFQQTYPGQKVVALPDDNPTEIICEVDPASEHPNLNVAIAAIKASTPHYHIKSTETYEVLEGELHLHVGNTEISLHKGQSYVIKPHEIHHATGNFTLVKVTSRPGWTLDDHFLV